MSQSTALGLQVPSKKVFGVDLEASEEVLGALGLLKDSWISCQWIHCRTPAGSNSE